MILGDSAWRQTQSNAVIVTAEKEEEEDISELLNQECRGVDALAVVREARNQLQESLRTETDDTELLEELFFERVFNI